MHNESVIDNEMIMVYMDSMVMQVSSYHAVGAGSPIVIIVPVHQPKICILNILVTTSSCSLSLEMFRQSVHPPKA